MKKHYHFIGIGGIGMGALASLALSKGLKVSGSDLRYNAMCESLHKKGATVYSGHHAQYVDNADVVIFSSAVRPDNPEMIRARERNVLMLQRAQLLAELMNDHIGVTVAGAHGKTTTSSMISNLLNEAGFNPTAAIGGVVNTMGSNAQLGDGKYFVAEVDESDGSFLYFYPQYSVITNIDLEHVDHYQGWDGVIAAYRQYISQTDINGFLLGCGDDMRLSQLLKQSGRDFLTYGLSYDNNIVAENIKTDGLHTEFDCYIDGKHLGVIFLQVPGKHNILNALACVGIAQALNIPFDVTARSLQKFTGVQRRFQVQADVDDILVVDDYAHHPTEIKAILETARNMQGKRIITVMQPHRYSRLEALMEAFAESLLNTDYLIVVDVYAASEQPIAGISAQALCDRIRAKTDKPVFYVHNQGLVDNLLNLVRTGDLVLMLGAGDITALSSDFVKALKETYINHKKKMQIV